MNLPLSFSPIAATSSTEETEALFGHQFVSSRIMNAARDDAFGVDMNGVQIGDCLLSIIHHRSDYKIDCGEVENKGSVMFGYGCGVPSSSSFNGREVNLNDHGVIVTKHSHLAHQRRGNSYEFVLKCTGGALESRLQSTLNRYTSGQLIFDETVPMDVSVGAHAKVTMSYIINSLDSNPELLKNPVVVSNFEELLLGAILSLPNNYSGQLENPEAVSAVPGLVVQAESFLERNAHLPVTQSDLLEHVGCSRSALFKNFRKFRSYTPWEFLTSRRLSIVRQRLLDANEGRSVTAIANELGFSHMGRFSQVYRKRYGEKPSETLRRSLN